MPSSSSDRRFYLLVFGATLVVWLATIAGPGDYPCVFHLARGWTLFCISRLPRLLPALLAVVGLCLLVREGMLARGARLRWMRTTLALAFVLALATWLLALVLGGLLAGSSVWGGPAPKKLERGFLGVSTGDGRRALVNLAVLVFPVVAILVSCSAFLVARRRARAPGWQRMLSPAILLPICLLAAVTPWARGRDTLNEVGSTPLLRAAKAGDRDMVDALLRAGANVNARDRFGWTPLLATVAQGDPVGVRQLLASGADVRAKAPTEAAEFAIGMLFGGGGLLPSMMGVDPNKSGRPTESEVLELLDHRGLTAPMLAVQAGSEEILRDVLEAGADPSYLQVEGESALVLAVRARRLDLIRLLLAFHADVRQASRGVPIVREAIDLEDEEVLRALLGAGATPEADDVCLAVEMGRVGCVKALIEAKADFSRRSSSGRTPLSLAKDPEIQALLRAAK